MFEERRMEALTNEKVRGCQGDMMELTNPDVGR